MIGPKITSAVFLEKKKQKTLLILFWNHSAPAEMEISCLLRYKKQFPNFCKDERDYGKTNSRLEDASQSYFPRKSLRLILLPHSSASSSKIPDPPFSLYTL